MDIAALSAAALPDTLAPSPKIAAPATAAVEQFNVLMNAPEVTPITNAPATHGVQAAVQAAFAPPLEPLPTIGTQILASLQSGATEFADKWQRIAGGLEQIAEQPRMADMMRVQAELLQVSVQYELVGKGISRATQDVDSLVRMN